MSAADIETLYTAVFANPDDVEARRALGAALRAVGDVRGELIALQLRALEGPLDGDADARLVELLLDYEDELMGPLLRWCWPSSTRYELGMPAEVALRPDAIHALTADEVNRQPWWRTVTTLCMCDGAQPGLLDCETLSRVHTVLASPGWFASAEPRPQIHTVGFELESTLDLGPVSAQPIAHWVAVRTLRARHLGARELFDSLPPTIERIEVGEQAAWDVSWRRDDQGHFTHADFVQNLRRAGRWLSRGDGLWAPPGCRTIRVQATAPLDENARTSLTNHLSNPALESFEPASLAQELLDNQGPVMEFTWSKPSRTTSVEVDALLHELASPDRGLGISFRSWPAYGLATALAGAAASGGESSALIRADAPPLQLEVWPADRTGASRFQLRFPSRSRGAEQVSAWVHQWLQKHAISFGSMHVRGGVHDTNDLDKRLHAFGVTTLGWLNIFGADLRAAIDWNAIALPSTIRRSESNGHLVLTFEPSSLANEKNVGLLARQLGDAFEQSVERRLGSRFDAVVATQLAPALANLRLQLIRTGVSPRGLMAYFATPGTPLVTLTAELANPVQAVPHLTVTVARYPHDVPAGVTDVIFDGPVPRSLGEALRAMSERVVSGPHDPVLPG